MVSLVFERVYLPTEVEDMKQLTKAADHEGFTAKKIKNNMLTLNS